jgi:hypothetical protein
MLAVIYIYFVECRFAKCRYAEDISIITMLYFLPFFKPFIFNHFRSFLNLTLDRSPCFGMADKHSSLLLKR